MGKKEHIKNTKQTLSSGSGEQEYLLNFMKIAELSGVCPQNAALCRIQGFPGKDAPGLPGSPRLAPGLIVNGEVCAGFPSPAEEELRDNISLDDYLGAHRETSFLLSVTGDSMTGAGILAKDLVIVERGRQPKNGDIILAEVDGNWTMKYFCKKGKNITLEAANPKYPPIVPQTELRIAGVITALVRKYHR